MYKLGAYELVCPPSYFVRVRRGTEGVSAWNVSETCGVYVYLASLVDCLLPQVVEIPCDEDVADIISCLLPPVELKRDERVSKRLGREAEGELWPVKDFAGARNKVNVRAREVLAGSKLPDSFWQAVLPQGITNDQAAGMIIWAEFYAHIYGLYGCAQILYWLIHDTPRAKHLSDRFKMLGLASSVAARGVIELPTLLGRGVGSLDGGADLAMRTDMSVAQSHLAKFSEHELRSAVARVFAEEMSGPVRVDAREHLLDRAIWAKSGGHSADWCKHEGTNVRPIRLATRTRAEYLGKVAVEELLASTPRVDICQVPKLEHGKVRWIYSCDTVSYAMTDCVLQAVESAWRGQSVLLNPDLGGPAVESRLRPSRDEVAVMLDYTDFNSQHSIKAMQIVFDELRKYVRGDEWVVSWVVDSLANMYVGGVSWVAGLPSGHRATTFINSVLNKAYCLAGLPRLPVRSYHAGDDVLLFYRGTVRPSEFLFPQAVFNESKQSYGGRAEFLRKHHCASGSYGYPCRAISSLVSGNWVSESIRDFTDTLRPLMNGVDTVENRLGTCGAVAHLFVDQVVREHECTQFVGWCCAYRRVLMPGVVARGMPYICGRVEEPTTELGPKERGYVAVHDALRRRAAVFTAEERRVAVELLEARMRSVKLVKKPSFYFTPCGFEPDIVVTLNPPRRTARCQVSSEDGFVKLVRDRVARIRDSWWNDSSYVDTVGGVIAPTGVASTDALGCWLAGRVVQVLPMNLVYV